MERQLSSKTIYRGAIFSMTQDEIALADGRTATRDVIHHHGGAGILAMREDEVLLVSQYRYAAQTQLWEIPAGKLEAKEDPKECVIRELNEEAGYVCEHVRFLCSFFTTPGFCDETIYLYLGSQPQPVKERLEMDPDEQIEIKWFPITHAYEMIWEGAIRDAKTIIALQYALAERNKQMNL